MANTTVISKDISPEDYEKFTRFMDQVGVHATIKPEHNVNNFISNIVGGVLKVISIERGKISCSLHVKAAILNGHGGMLGGAVTFVAERIAIACVRTIVGEDKDIFLTQQSISYLSSAPKDAEVIVDGAVIKSGRNVTIVEVNFRLKESGRLAYMTRSTFYNMPVSSL